MVALLLVLSSCELTGSALPVARIEVPEEVRIEDATYGRTTSSGLEVANRGSGSDTIQLRVEEPFQLSVGRLTLEAGAVHQVAVIYQPNSYEPVEAALTLRTALQELQVRVVGTTDPDADGDGHPSPGVGGDDCDDLDPDTWPGAPEVCDGRDNDCDGEADEVAVDATTWYPDADGDGWGTAQGALEACLAPTGFASHPGDCDETDPQVNPGARERWYDGVDQDCDGWSDYDQDRDGYDIQRHGGEDCLDTSAAVHPGAEETWYDGVDQDCDGWSDYDQDRDGWDHDGHGGLDCDDLDPLVSPSAEETTDDRDEDCDTWIDEHLLQRGEVLLTELMIDPESTPDADGQYLELYNASSRDIHLDGFALEADSGTAVLGPLLLTPGDAALLCANTSAADNGGLACDGSLPGVLGDDDRAELSASLVLDEVDWAGWSIPTGASLELSSDALDPDLDDLPGSWCTATDDLGNGDLGTPGEVDTTCR